MARVKITDEQIIEDILKVKEKVGKVPTQDNYKKYGSFSINSILNRNPWNIWLKELFGATNAEFSNGNGMKVSNEDLLNNLRNIINEIGRVPEQKELSIGKYSLNAYKRAFGNYSLALKELGLNASIRYNLSDKEILEDIVRVYEELGRVPSFDEFNKLNNTISAVSVCNKFGSWNAAVKESGLDVINKRNIPKEEVVQAIKDWVKKNNNDIGCLEYWQIRKAKERGEFPFCVNTISEKFNNKSWEDIMKECGYNYETVDQFIKRGCFQGYDGRTYLSSIEKQVGDHLNNLKKEGKISDYEYEKKVCGDRNWTCDFVIEDNNMDKIWLEIDGMLNNRKDPYNSDENEKIEYYKSNNFNYFVISYRTPDVKKAICELVGE